MISSILTSNYTLTGLVYGTVYNFRVQSRNAFGISAYSSVISILAASRPNAPVAPTTSVVNGNSVTIRWTAPIDNGSPIFGYII